MDPTPDLLVRHKLDVDDYHRMGEAGILHEDDRVELIEGELIDMAPIGPDHAGTVNGLAKALVMACGDHAVVAVQNPVRLDRHSEPQPDFALLRPRADQYSAAHPGPADILALIEVADTSLRFDRAIKLPLYARAGVPELWIVDLAGRSIAVHRDPGDGAYATALTVTSGDAVTLASEPRITVPLAHVFG